MFLYFWVKEVENERLNSLGRSLGTTFTAGEIRSWKASGSGSPEYKDQDKVFVPLALTFQPELREGLLKLVGMGGMKLPSDYKRGAREVVVDMSKVTPAEFLAFLGKGILPKTPEAENAD